ncbi:MAG: STAS domain-containing protein [Pseudomonadota bacterium]
MSVDFSTLGNVLVMRPAGPFGTGNTHAAEQALLAHLDAGTTRLLIDFGQTNYVSSAGLRVILKAAKRLRQQGGRLVLVRANPLITEVLDISGFLDLLPCRPTLEEGMAWLESSSPPRSFRCLPCVLPT